MAINAVLIGTRGTSSSNTVTTASGTSTGGSGTVGLIVCSFDPSTTQNTPTDSKSNTWSQVGTAFTAGGGPNAKIAVYQCQNWTGGASHTATMTFSGTAFPTLHLLEITGAATSAALDISVTGSTSVSGGGTGGLASGTLGQAAEVVISIAEINDGAAGSYSSSSPAGVSVLSQEPDTGSFWTSAVSRLVVSSTSSVTPLWGRTNNSSNTFGFRVLSFKEATGGGGDVSAALTGVAGTAAVGTSAPSSSTGVTGLAATGAVGALADGTAVGLTGAAAATALGTMTPSSGSQADLTGVATTGAPGTAAAALSFGLTGVAATGEVGSTGIALQAPFEGARRRRIANVPAVPLNTRVRFRRTPRNTSTVPELALPLTGVVATGEVNTAAVAVVRLLPSVAATGEAGVVNGVVTVREGSRRRAGGVFPGDGPYSFARYFKPRRHSDPTPTAVQALSGAAGTGQVGTVRAARTVAVTGTSASAAVGSVGAEQAGVASLTAAAAVTSPGQLSTSTTVALSGVAASAAAGTLVEIEGVILALSGVQAGSAVGAFGFGVSNAVSGVAGSGTIGTVFGGTPGTWVPVNTGAAPESWTSI